MATGKEIMERLPWWRLETHPEWIEPSASLDDVYAPYSAGIPGELVVLYLPKGVPPWGQSPMVAGLEPGQRYRATYINPITADVYSIDDVEVAEGEAWSVPASPILQDWVLVLEAINAQETSDTP